MWALHLPQAKMPRIESKLQGLICGKRGLAALRVLPNTDDTLELTWKDCVGYQSVYTWCVANIPHSQHFALELLTGTAFHIEDPRVPINILELGILG
jgi:hypothetical protein